MDIAPDIDLTVPRSCWSCHKRKVKCDRAFPCSTCVRTKTSCSYPELEKRKKLRKVPVSALLGRLAQLEKKVSTLSKVQQTTESSKSNVSSLASKTLDYNTPTEYERQIPKGQGVLVNTGEQSKYFSDEFMASIAKDVS
jgi:hypothetical protein